MDQTKRILRRILEAALIIFCIVVINFVLIRFMPGDPVMHILGESTYLRLEVEDPATIEEVRRLYGLDQPVWRQFLIYLGKTLRLDFGISYTTKLPVARLVWMRMKWTLMLTFPAIVLSALLGGTLGLFAGWNRGKLLDTVCSPIMLFISSVPTNCLGILLLIYFAFQLHLFPVAGMTSGGLTGLAKALDILWHMALPLFVLVLYKTSYCYMLMKSAVQGIREEEYVTVARSKGFTQIGVLFRHALKNALCPYVTAVCMQFGHILSGSMMTEVVFSWKGMGLLIYESVNTKDFPVLQTCFLAIGTAIVLCNLLADGINAVIDPSIRQEGKHA